MTLFNNTLKVTLKYLYKLKVIVMENIGKIIHTDTEKEREITNNEVSAAVASLREEMIERIEELKSVIRFAMSTPKTFTPREQVAAIPTVAALRTMTAKQHAAMQMWLVSDMRIADMARRMECSRNTARLHLKAFWVKMGTEEKAILKEKVQTFLKDISDSTYKEWSGGLPIDWAKDYKDGKQDHYSSLYVKSKHNTYPTKE